MFVEEAVLPSARWMVIYRSRPRARARVTFVLSVSMERDSLPELLAVRAERMYGPGAILVSVNAPVSFVFVQAVKSGRACDRSGIHSGEGVMVTGTLLRAAPFSVVTTPPTVYPLVSTRSSIFLSVMVAGKVKCGASPVRTIMSPNRSLAVETGNV